MPLLNPEEKRKIKEQITNRTDSEIASIQARMDARKINFDYENSKDQQKLDELSIQKEGLDKIK